MVYIKIFLCGIGGAVLTSALWIIARSVLPVWGPYVIRRLRGTGGVSEGYVGSDSILIAALIGFIIASALAWFRLRGA